MNRKYEGQYSKLWVDGEELLMENPRSIMNLLLDRVSLDDQLKFLRFYMCLNVVNKGF